MAHSEAEVVLALADQFEENMRITEEEVDAEDASAIITQKAVFVKRTDRTTTTNSRRKPQRRGVKQVSEDKDSDEEMKEEAKV